jgi:hypothetical protein
VGQVTFILPREAGKGDRPKGGGRGVGRDVSLIAHAPSTTLRVVPLPRFAGADK